MAELAEIRSSSNSFSDSQATAGAPGFAWSLSFFFSFSFSSLAGLVGLGLAALAGPVVLAALAGSRASAFSLSSLSLALHSRFSLLSA